MKNMLPTSKTLFRAAFSTTAIALVLNLNSLAHAADLPATVVKKTVEDFSTQAWKPGQYLMGAGAVSLDSSFSPELKGGTCLKMDANFSGEGGFENYSVGPAEPLYIPGNAQRITVRVKRSDPRFPLSVTFHDGWGRAQVGEKYLSLDLRFAPNQDWQTLTVDIPKDWVRPIQLFGVSTHNFSAPKKKVSVSFWVDDIEVETDLANTDEATGMLKTWTPDPNPQDPAKALTTPPITPLVSVGLSTPEICNVFSDSEPSICIRLQNWKPATLTGTATLTLLDDKGTQLKEWNQALQVDGVSYAVSPIPVNRNGLYSLKTQIALSDSTKQSQKITFAKVPNQKDPSEEEKRVSPYGINYHGGGVHLFKPFKKAGIYWFRDYAFNLDYLRKAKGPDRKYSSWPGIPTLIRDYADVGVNVLPVLEAISKPVIKDGKVVSMGPDEKWIRDVADIMITFPSPTYWEISNEYDLSFKQNLAAERLVNWENYRLYHKKFAELVDLLGNGKWTTVENGRAGIYPKLTEDCVKSGDFKRVGVVNVHHYCGADAPELNAENYNRGIEAGQIEGFFFDSLRMTKQVASADGIKREAWLTEVGWDTLAGPVVTPEQQAAYLQRGFMLSFSAGIDKVFWFFHFDSAKAVQFFDGCGLFTADYQPKLSLPAMAGLTSVLPHPVYIGSINAGPNTAGYVFENDGSLVAGLWALQGDKGPAVPVKAKELKDYFGNPVQGLTMQLKMAPTFAVGLDKKDPLFLQTAYEIASPHMMVVTAGDPVNAVIGVKNNRGQIIDARMKIDLPEGWTGPQADVSTTVPADQQAEVLLPFVVGADEKLGTKSATIHISESGKPVKSMPVSFKIQRPFSVEVEALHGAPGKTRVNVEVVNKTATSQNGKIVLTLPKSWHADSLEVAVDDLKPQEKRQVPVELTWSPEWDENESAQAMFQSTSNLAKTAAPIIPNISRIHKASGITIDGNLADWKPAFQVPAWMVGSTLGEANAKMWLAWSPEGIYGAVEVEDSKGSVEDPERFWTGDVLELFLSTLPDQRGDSFHKGDHQLWAAPLLKENQVFVGRWKVKDEIPANQFRLAGVKSAAKRTSKGYLMEFLIPATSLDSPTLKSGSTLAMNLNLSIKGVKFDREVYWPQKKASGVTMKPTLWGTMKLVD